MDNQQALTRLHDALGLKRLNRLWAKLEILLGLSAAGFGIFLGLGAVPGLAGTSWPQFGAALVLFVLGGYLAMAGSRSYLYQSNNALAAYLAE